MSHYKGISADDKHKIVTALKARGAGSCPRCNDSQWTVSEFLRIDVQATMDRDSMERSTIPAIMVVCEHCGFISQHALQPLGVWPHSAAEIQHKAPRGTEASTH
ncbi:MAG TPA: hypothetical protein VF836_05770 [Gemmatimonadaceae bacterium]